MKQLIALQLLSTFFMLMISGCQKECDQWHTGKKCDTEIRLNYFPYDCK